MDTGDVTVTVDPAHRDQWIYDGYTKHDQSQVRGLRYDKEAFQRALNWEKADHGTPQLFNPTVRQLDVLPKFATCQEWNGTGRLPVISQQLYDGSLQNKSTAQIEHEIRESSRRQSARLFDKSGYTR